MRLAQISLFIAIESLSLVVSAIYGRVPGERYLSFLKTLTEEQRSLVRNTIFDQALSKDEVRRELEQWAHDESPLTMQAFDRSQMIYDMQADKTEQTLDERARHYSEAAKQLDAQIRGIYNNGSLTERQACETASHTIQLALPETRKETGLEPLDCDKIFARILEQ